MLFPFVHPMQPIKSTWYCAACTRKAQPTRRKNWVFSCQRPYYRHTVVPRRARKQKRALPPVKPAEDCFGNTLSGNEKECCTYSVRVIQQSVAVPAPYVVIRPFTSSSAGMYLRLAWGMPPFTCLYIATAAAVPCTWIQDCKNHHRHVHVLEAS